METKTMLQVSACPDHDTITHGTYSPGPDQPLYCLGNHLTAFQQSLVKDLKPIGQKAPLSLLPLGPLGALAGVLEHGAAKYTKWNWQDDSQPQARMEELLNAAIRHTLAINDPSVDEFDEESGMHHAAHAAVSLIIYLHKRKIGYTPSKLIHKEVSFNALSTTITSSPEFDRS